MDDLEPWSSSLPPHVGLHLRHHVSLVIPFYTDYLLKWRFVNTGWTGCVTAHASPFLLDLLEERLGVTKGWKGAQLRGTGSFESHVCFWGIWFASELLSRLKSWREDTDRFWDYGPWSLTNDPGNLIYSEADCLLRPAMITENGADQYRFSYSREDSQTLLKNVFSFRLKIIKKNIYIYCEEQVG